MQTPLYEFIKDLIDYEQEKLKIVKDTSNQEEEQKDE